MNHDLIACTGISSPFGNSENDMETPNTVKHHPVFGGEL